MEAKEDIKDQMKKSRTKSQLTKRKHNINQKIWNSRLLNSSNQNQLQEVDEEQEVHTEKPVKGYLPLHQHQNSHYHRRRRKGKKCWFCKSRGHLKRDCPMIKCFYCGKPGHIKKKCIWWELHEKLSILKDKQKAEPRTEEKQRKQKNHKQTARDRMRLVTFRQEGKDQILVYKGIDLGSYFGDYPFSVAKRGFEAPTLPQRLMEKVIKVTIPVKQLKHSDYLPHQCGQDGEVYNGYKFSIHCNHHHKGWVPANSLINASPYRFWIYWYDDENFTRFMETRGEPRFTRVAPPWV